MSTTETQRQYRCRHLRTNGSQCGSPALREEHFCFYHHNARVPAPAPSEARSIADSAFDLPMPENRAVIQYALGEVLRRIAAQHLDVKTGRALIHGLAVAARNLPKPIAEDHMPVAEPATEIIIDPIDGILAPASPLATGAPAPLEPGQQRISPARHRREQRAAAQQRIYDQLAAARQKDAAREAERKQAIEGKEEPQVDHLRTETPQPTPIQTQTPRPRYVTPPDSPELQRILRLIPPTLYDHDYSPSPEDYDTAPKPWQQSAIPTWLPTDHPTT